MPLLDNILNGSKASNKFLATLAAFKNIILCHSSCSATFQSNWREHIFTVKKITYTINTAYDAYHYLDAKSEKILTKLLF